MGATTTFSRDVNGSLITGKCIFYPYATDVATMEALAVKDGLHLSNSLGINRIESGVQHCGG